MNRYIAFILAAAYCFEVQGRIGCFSDLVLSDAESLINGNRTLMLDSFKTASTYGFQAIPIPDWLRQYIRFYTSTIRSKVIAALNSNLQKQLLQPNAPLWINMNGTKQNGSSLLSGFFRARGLNLTR